MLLEEWRYNREAKKSSKSEEGTAVNALGHVNVVTSRATRTILTCLGVNGDGHGWADHLTQLAGNAPFFSYILCEFACVDAACVDAV